MPALNVSFDDTEMEPLRAAAQEADESLKDFVHNAALLRADRHRQQVAAAAQTMFRSRPQPLLVTSPRSAITGCSIRRSHDQAPRCSA